MKKTILTTLLFLGLFYSKAFSQTVYISQTGGLYHTKACKLYTKNFEAVDLWKAKNAFGKKPCPKCKPPIKEIAKKKIAAKPKPKTAPAKKK